MKKKIKQFNRRTSFAPVERAVKTTKRVTITRKTTKCGIFSLKEIIADSLETSYFYQKNVVAMDS